MLQKLYHLKIVLFISSILFIFFFISCQRSEKKVDKIAFANLEFGISKAEYNSKIDSVLSSLDKSDGYYKVGDFIFNSIAPDYHNDNLVKITLYGYKYSSIYLIRDATKKISESLSEKYGKNKNEYDFLSDDYLDVSSVAPGPRWDNNFKAISLKYIKSSSGYELIMEVEDIIGVIDKEHQKYQKQKENSDKIKEIL